jgi:phage terminase large subunit
VTAFALDWKQPDYAAVYAERIKRLESLRGDPSLLTGVKEFYKTHPVEFIEDWCMTFDPRNVERDLPATVPFVLFPRQVQFVEWVVERWRSREDGVGEKSRDMGVSWLCVAVAAWMWLFYPGIVAGFGSRKESYVDDLNNPNALFWKARNLIGLLPRELQPAGWDEKKNALFMKITNPENGSVLIGEAGDNIGRGGRTSIYFVDEAAFLEHAEAIDAALSQTSNCKLYISTPNGSGNPFYRKRHSGKYKVFVFDWREDPRKDAAWYQRQCEMLDPVIVAQEIDRNYEGSVSNAFVPADLVATAQARGPADIRPVGGLRVGIDVARFGDDKTVISFRRGRVLLKQVVLSQLDVAQVAGRAKSEISAYAEAPEQIAVDTIGIGAGVADMMRAWYPDKVDRVTSRKVQVVVDVNSSLRMGNGEDYNLRAFMWREMREWLKGASLPNDQDLRTDLTALRYLFKGGELLIESKDDAKRRGVKSPDRGDSLAMTFAIPTIVDKSSVPYLKPFEPSTQGMGILG